MKQIIKLTKDRAKNIYHVVSEPGDATRYDYFVYRDGPDEFCFMPCKSIFVFPQRLSWYEIHLKEEELIRLAKFHACNVWTLKECIRTMEELHEKQ